MKLNRLTVGLILLLVMIATNVIWAMKYYHLADGAIKDFFYSQAQENELFDPNVRY